MAMVVALMIAVGLAAAPQVEAPNVVVGQPAQVAEIDAGKLKGTVVRMAWSPDATQLYLQTAEPDTRGNVKLRHYTMALDGQPPKSVAAEPDWAASYWAWKSSQAAPGMASWKIAIDQQQKRVSSTSNPAGGDLAKGATEGGGAGTGGAGAGGGAGGMSMGEAAGAAYQSQNATVVTLKLKGEVVGEFINAPALPGTTFGWGPTGSGLVVFTPPDGKVVVMDAQSRKQEVAGSKAAYLPAWTTDGKRIAYLEKSGKKKFLLRVADVTIPAK
jgi:hypothetical protein